MKPAVAEFLGTFILCFVGILGGSLMAQPSIAHGFILVGIIPVFAAISGSHFNPAVTAGLWATKHVTSAVALTYMAAQIAGGIVAAFLAKMLMPPPAPTSSSVPLLNIFLAEAILTMILVAVVTIAVRRGLKPYQAGIGVGFTLVALILAGQTVSGAALNPARALGPMVANGDFANIAIYMVAPIVGGVIGALLLTWLDSAQPAEA